MAIESLATCGLKSHWFRKWRARKPKLLVLGDSHTEVFRDSRFISSYEDRFDIYICAVGGATASGLSNPNSKTDAINIFTNGISIVDPDTVILQLGEVDCGFVLWYRAEKYGESIQKLLERSIDNYISLIEKLKNCRSVLVLSAPLPTIKDDQDWGEVANERRGVKASQIDRTKLTVQFNRRLGERIRSEQVKFISFDKFCLGDDGVVNSELLHSDPTDHHYAVDAYLPMLLKGFEKLL